jgi:uncharacterized membrane protein
MQITGKNLHPAFVHFPLTLFPLSLLFLVLFWFQDNPFFLHASYWAFMIGALIIVPVAWTGWIDWLDLRDTQPESEAGRVVNFHVRNGIAITIISLVTAIFFLWQKPMAEPMVMTLYTITTSLLTLMVILQGYVGGQMVYRFRIGVKPESSSS